MGMVLGEGLIANRFSDYSLQSKYLIYAGKIHDSTLLDEGRIHEEEAAISTALSANNDKVFVYFSSCSILDENMHSTPYVNHKIRMERLIQKTSKSFLIIRVPQLMGLSDVGSSLVNYLFDSIVNGKPFELWEDAQKNLIDIDDVHEIVGVLLGTNSSFNKVFNIASTHQTSVSAIVREIEAFTGRAGVYTNVSKGSSYKIDIEEIETVLNGLCINFGESYIKNSLNKYFKHFIDRSQLISIIVPTYNEELGIEEFYRRTKDVLNKLSPRFEHEIIFVNDYSTDNTLIKLNELATLDPTVKVINFSRNFGNQVGITAGIDFSQGDIAVVIDDDLQDPPEVILNLIAKWDKGYKVVYGVRPNRQGVNIFFKLAAMLYYRLIGMLSDTKIPNDTGDFRLLDRVVIDSLKQMKEENRYYRGMVAWVGFSQVGIFYERDRRYAGVSTFSFKKYINFALNGLTSFTDKPLFFSSLLGLIITFVSFFLALVLTISKILDPTISIRGWTSLTVVILFFGGVQLLSTGILGIYVSKIYREVKGRPLYLIDSSKNIQIGKAESPTK